MCNFHFTVFIVGKFVQHFIIEINDILILHHFLHIEHGQCGKTVLWNCATLKRFHFSQSPGTPLTFCLSDEGSNYHLEETKHFCTEITISSAKHFHKPWNTAEFLSFVRNRRFGIQPLFTQERASLNCLIQFGRSKETVSCICVKNKGG